MKKRSKTKISFDEEVISQDHAKQLVFDEQELASTKEEQSPTTAKPNVKEKRNKKRPREDQTKRDKSPTRTIKQPKLDNNTTTNAEPKKPSNRSLKREKHAKLLADEKLHTELELQQKALNYLSKWKHSKSEWKFEKLRQVWLERNLYDASKLPNEFWDTVVQYFGGSKGRSRQVVLDKAIEVIDNEEKVAEEENGDIKLKRARDIIQNLH